MTRRKFAIGALGVIFAMLVWWVIQGSSPRYLMVAFLDVGQGDAIFVETPDKVQVLIDGGQDRSVIAELGSVMPWWDRSIDLVIGTHPDQDHMGGLVSVLSSYRVDTYIESDWDTQKSFHTHIHTLIEDNIATKVWEPSEGEVVRLGHDVEIKFINTAPSLRGDTNDASLVVLLSHGNVSYLLTGDISQQVEEDLVGVYGELLESEVLKLSHHGSRTSSSEIFIDAVKPEIGIVSAGEDNSYGHPHPEIVKRFVDRGIALWDTATKNTIVTESDGASIWIY